MKKRITYAEYRASLPAEVQKQLTLEVGFYIIAAHIRKGEKQEAFDKIKELMTVLELEVDEDFFE